MKIAVNEGLSELRRKKWSERSLNDLTISHENDKDQRIEFPVVDTQPGPDRKTHESMVVQNVLSIIENEMSPKQKQAMMALMVHDIPISIVAEQMGIKRNALYKLIHDARLNLKQKMLSSGIDPEEVLKQM